MVIVWSLLPESGMVAAESMGGIEQVTLKLLLQQPSALQGFGDPCEAGRLSSSYYRYYKDKLQRICDQARVKQSPLDSTSQ